MGASFTAGPWIVDVEDKEIRNEDGAGIATFPMFEDFPCAEDDQEEAINAESLANAQLIATSPDYHAAAVALCERHDEAARRANFAFCGCEDCKPFRAIIAKATEGNAQ